jgi:cysteinyl-tRNA synthetase
LLAKFQHQRPSSQLLAELDKLFGLDLSKRTDIAEEQKQQMMQREAARKAKDFGESDRIRAGLETMWGLTIEDTELGPRWRRSVI